MTDYKSEFNNICYIIYCETKHLELYIELLEKIEKMGNLNSELIKIIKNSFGLQIANIFSRIIEDPKRKSANIHFIKRFTHSEIKNLSKNEDNEDKEKILRQLVSDIDNFEKIYEADSKVFKGIKDVKISHNDLVLAKLGQTKELKFSLMKMKEIKNMLINIFKKFIPKNKDNFKKEYIDKIKNELDLFCKNL